MYSRSLSFLNNTCKLYTAEQYNQMRASIGSIQLPAPQTPQEAKIQRATTTNLTIRDKVLIGYIKKVLRDPQYPTEYQQALNTVVKYLQHPETPLDQLL